MSNATVVRSYLDAFTSGDFDAALAFIADDFSFEGPMLQSVGKAAFIEGSQAAQAMARGYTMHRQLEDGDDVVSIYDFELGAPATPGTVLMTEWNTVRNGKLASAKLVFDTAQFAALMPQG
ncbi:MAG: nuclear transport factor 2 family protein [Actinomycetota bacterium]